MDSHNGGVSSPPGRQLGPGSLEGLWVAAKEEGLSRWQQQKPGGEMGAEQPRQLAHRVRSACAPGKTAPPPFTLAVDA